jgi:hypothetical protein
MQTILGQVGSLAEHVDVLIKLLAATFALLLSLLYFEYRQLVKRIDQSSTEQEALGGVVRATREEVIRMSERLAEHIRHQDALVADFRTRFEKSDTLHMQILTRLGKMMTGRTPSPMAAAGENGE